MERSASLSENELLFHIANGDQKAFDRLFENYRDRLFHYLQKITKSTPNSEEFVLDVFLKIWTERSIVERYYILFFSKEASYQVTLMRFGSDYGRLIMNFLILS